jgi:AcrR family transcriptional regulator
VNQDTRYHHGALKETLITLGLELLESQGVQALSLREIASKAGVSKTAPYRHFESKETFLAALTNQGFYLLVQGLHKVLEPQNYSNHYPSRRETLKQMGKVYLHFGQKHPALYRLMHSDILSSESCPPIPWAKTAFDTLAQAILDPKQEQKDMSQVISAWGYIHGVTMICIDRIFPPYYAEPDWDELATKIESFASA